MNIGLIDVDWRMRMDAERSMCRLRSISCGLSGIFTISISNMKTCKDCFEYVEMGCWCVNGRLEPYGKCMRRFNIYLTKPPCSIGLDELARVKWNDNCAEYKPKEIEIWRANSR